MIFKESRLHTLRKAVSILCGFSVLLSSVPVVSLLVRAAGQHSATQSQRFMYDDAVIYMDKTLIDNGSGYYTLTVDAEAYLKKTDVPEDITTAREGAVEIRHDGYYLIELWGGNGASGSTSLQSEGGTGGAGGHIYGIIHLTKGQTLVYTIGTNGQQIPGINVDSGGGENEGGDKEGISTYATGGGGGYSAVYLFNSAHSEKITEQERVNNYIMIAGGGGGGGAGNEWGVTATGTPDGGHGGTMTTSQRGTLTAEQNNGVAGIWFGGADGFSSGTNVTHVGKGGTNYIGESNFTGLLFDSELLSYAGKSANDWVGTYTYQEVGYENSTPIYADVPAGQGGAGFLRGGAGGAGFCGGSGGLQTSLLFASNIGGGGGGSSFAASLLDIKTSSDGDKADGSPKYEAYSQYIEGFQSNRNGGKVNITYLGETTIDQDKYKHTDLNLEISQYFDVLSVSAKKADGSENGKADISVQGEKTDKTSTVTNINIIDADISPDSDGSASNALSVTVLLRAKTDFAGGNNVPVVLTQPSIRAQSSEGDISVMPENAATDYANVPLNFKAVANSYATSDKTKKYAAAELYTDNYASVRNSLSNYWQYDFISSITTYGVRKGSYQTYSSSTITGNVIPPTAVNSSDTYTVSFRVTPKTGTTAAVGDSVGSSKDFYAHSTITLLGQDELKTDDLGTSLDRTVTAKFGKSVNYDEAEGFVLEIDADISFENATGYIQDGNTYTITEDGWYYIEALGGGGGGSGVLGTEYNDTWLSSSQYKKSSKSADVEGKGGNRYYTAWAAAMSEGGYTGGYIHLSAYDKIEFTLGEKGDTASHMHDQLEENYSGKVAYSAGGGAGTGTKVTLVSKESNKPVLIMGAGGGGGAGGGSVALTTTALNYIPESAKAHAVAGEKGAVSYAVTGSISDKLDGTSGTAGYGEASCTSASKHYTSATAGTPGTAGENYISTDFNSSSAPDIVKETYKSFQGITIAAGDGQAKLHLIISDDAVTDAEELTQGFEAEGAITRYFDVNDIEMNFDSAVNSSVITTDAEGWTTKTYASSETGLTLGSFSYKITRDGLTDSDGAPYSTYSIRNVAAPAVSSDSTVSIKPSFTVNITPKEGFIGGNDVPLVKSDVLEPNTEITDWAGSDCGVAVVYKNKGLYLSAQDRTDFVNVPLSYTFQDENFDVVPEKTIICGESLPKSELVLKNTVPLYEGEENAWKADYAEGVAADDSGSVAPPENRTYVFTQEVRPKYSAVKAKVAGDIVELTVIKRAKVYVNYKIDTDLTNITYEGLDLVPDDQALTATLKADQGYELPAEITVERGGSKLSTSYYTYDSSTGELKITATYLTGNIKITAAAVVKKYTLYYYYTDKPAEMMSPDATTQYNVYEETYTAGQSIGTPWYVNHHTPQEYTGYSFQWDWSTENNEPLTEMPAYDYAVWGTYVKNQHTLTVNYYREGADTPFAVYTEKLYYGDAYEIVAPQENGYITDNIFISGIMGDKDVVEDIYYTPSDNQLNIYYIYADSNTEAKLHYNATLGTGKGYSVKSPEIEGYTPSEAVVSGSMAAEGVTVYVYYNPNQYTVTFKVDGTDFATKTVAFNNIYGFDPTVAAGSQYSALPTPYKDGMDFEGWYLDPELTKPVNEETRVETAGDHTLYAKFKEHEFILTVRHQYGDGSYKAIQYKYAANEPYSIEITDIPEGYSPYINGVEVTAVEGTMGYANTVVTVDYFKEAHTVTVKLWVPNSKKEGDYREYESTQTGDLFGTGYTFDIPDLTNLGYTVQSEMTIEEYPEGAELPVYTPPSNGNHGTITGSYVDAEPTINIYCDFIDYKLTVHYLYEDGTEAAPSVTSQHYVGENNIVVYSPDPDDPANGIREGYHPESEKVIINSYPAEDVEKFVLYVKNSYTLRIEYLYEDGTEAAPLYEKTDCSSHDTYSVESPYIAGFTPDIAVVTGVILSDVNVTVTYSKADEIISVTVSLTDMKFDYNGVWDPETHTYKDADGLTLRAGSDNSVVVENEGTVPVTATVEYAGKEGAAYDLTAKLTATEDSSAGEAAVINERLNPSSSLKRWLWLSGKINAGSVFAQNGEASVGTVTVTIGKVGGS